ncbi:MAG TPA: hypothetical protein VKB19_01440 [Pedobacter sp.]|nr:hypothetical protein [Pedobacter sp.]
MKNSFLIAVCVAALQILCTQTSSAQESAPYKTGVGLMLDLGTGGTYVGPHAKHFFTANHAGQAMVLFGSGLTVIGVEYSYNKAIPGVEGLNWNLGLGPQFYFVTGSSGFMLRPQAGIEFKVPKAPIAAGFDWRPMFQLSHDTSFEPARFALAFKYAF